jgi:hypothetical protein
MQPTAPNEKIIITPAQTDQELVQAFLGRLSLEDRCITQRIDKKTGNFL